MNMTHTPGPWRATFAYDDPAVVDQDGRLVAMAVWDGEAMPEPDVFAANARLIAAAPELLAALHGVLHWAECECKRLADDTPASDEPRMCDFCVAQAVIDKAEGRTE